MCIHVVKLTFVCRVVVPLIFKNVRRIKKVYNKRKFEKNRRQIQQPLTDLKMEFLAQIVNNFTL